MSEKTKIITAISELEWFVRDENDEIFGPVDFQTLKLWVEDGRISPLSYISGDDRTTWQAAVDLPELEMDAIAEIEPGSFYGPIHRMAMTALIESGSIPRDSVIYQKDCTGHKSVADSAAATHSMEEIQRLQAESEHFATALEELRSAVCKRETECSDLRAKQTEIADQCKKLDALNHELAAEKEALNKELAELCEKNRSFASAMNAEIAHLREELEDAHSRERLLASECSALNSRSESLQDNLKEQQRLSDDNSKLHAAEKKEIETAFSLRLEKIEIAHETELSHVHKQYLDRLQELEHELRNGQSEVKSLREINRMLEKEKLPNDDSSAERRLALLRQLFIDAATLLEYPDQPSLESCVEDNDDGVDTPELLDFEEVNPQDSPHTLKKERVISPPPDNKAASEARSVDDTLSSRDNVDGKGGHGDVHCAFAGQGAGSTRNSLAELEAQARRELQRLSASGNLATIFNKKSK